MHRAPSGLHWYSGHLHHSGEGRDSAPPRMISGKPPHLGRASEERTTATNGSGRGRRPRHRAESHTATPRNGWKGMHRAPFGIHWHSGHLHHSGTPPAEIETAGAHPLFHSDLNTTRHPVEVDSRKPPNLGRVSEGHDTATDASGRGRRPRIRKEEPHGHTSERMEGNAPRTLRPSSAFLTPPPLGTPPAEVKTAGHLHTSELRHSHHARQYVKTIQATPQPDTSADMASIVQYTSA